jgi:hypothetical protein
VGAVNRLRHAEIVHDRQALKEIHEFLGETLTRLDELPVTSSNGLTVAVRVILRGAVVEAGDIAARLLRPPQEEGLW